MSEPSLIDHSGAAAIAAVVVALGKVLEVAIRKINGTSASDSSRTPTNERLAALEARLTAHENEDQRFFTTIKEWMERLDAKLDRLFLRHMKED